MLVVKMTIQKNTKLDELEADIEQMRLKLESLEKLKFNQLDFTHKSQILEEKVYKFLLVLKEDPGLKLADDIMVFCSAVNHAIRRFIG